MTWIVWIIIAVTLVIFEILTPSTFFFICFSIGSLSAAVAAYFDVLYGVELAVFIIASVISLYLIRPVFKKIIAKSKTVHSNIDALIGAEAVVIEKITPLKTGFVKVLSEIWRAESDVELEAGEIVKIKNISGTTLIVKKRGTI
ncbi:MAG: NfeD family protein [Endomicrobium sp.]|jgi:membrane protein implicated in regulation of membrane protease activity|nr:NfeD family protein [Endomicrobium sp.]